MASGIARRCSALNVSTGSCMFEELKDSLGLAVAMNYEPPRVCWHVAKWPGATTCQDMRQISVIHFSVILCEVKSETTGWGWVALLMYNPWSRMSRCQTHLIISSASLSSTSSSSCWSIWYKLRFELLMMVHDIASSASSYITHRICMCVQILQYLCPPASSAVSCWFWTWVSSR